MLTHRPNVLNNYNRKYSQDFPLSQMIISDRYEIGPNALFIHAHIVRGLIREFVKFVKFESFFANVKNSLNTVFTLPHSFLILITVIHTNGNNCHSSTLLLKLTMQKSATMNNKLFHKSAYLMLLDYLCA